MSVVVAVSVEVGEPPAEWHQGPNRGPHILPDVTPRSILDTQQQAKIGSLSMSFDALFSLDVWGHVTLKLSPDESMFVLEGELGLSVDSLRRPTQVCLDTIRDLADDLAAGMLPGQQLLIKLERGTKKEQQEKLQQAA